MDEKNMSCNVKIESLSSPEEQLLHFVENENVHQINNLLSSYNIDINYQKVLCIMCDMS